jgi:hypothetical protein
LSFHRPSPDGSSRPPGKRKRLAADISTTTHARIGRGCLSLETELADVLKFLIGLVGVIAIMMGLAWAFTGNDFFIYKYFAPQYEQTRRDVFKGSEAYREGVLQELSQMHLDYIKGTPEQKAAISSIVMHRISYFDTKLLTPELRDFIAEVRNEQSK